MMQSALILLSAVSAVIAVPFLLVGFYVRVGMFKPTKEHLETPAGVGVQAPVEVFVDSGGEKLHCWYFRAGASAPTILYVHGNAGNIADRLKVIKGYVNLGFNVFIYDPRGYGKSGGIATADNFIQDAVSAYDHLTKHIGADPSQITVLGQSLGGMAALPLANNFKCKGLVLEGTFVSVRQLAKDLYPKLPLWLFVSNIGDNEAEMRKLKLPVLLICGEHDDTIPPAHSKRLFEAAKEPRELLVVKGATHTDMYAKEPGLYYGAMGRFVKQ
jgi:hypothetical protein